MPASDFYGQPGSLFVEAYDAFHAEGSSQYAGDVAFYLALARSAPGPTLEVACGTGRVTLPLALAGVEITGIDLSPGMLATAAHKATSLPSGARIRFARQDMAELALETRFGFAFVPFRSFQFLLTAERQRQALDAIHHHLVPGGRLALHLFDPRHAHQSGGASIQHRCCKERHCGILRRIRLDSAGKWLASSYAVIHHGSIPQLVFLRKYTGHGPN